MTDCLVSSRDYRLIHYGAKPFTFDPKYVYAARDYGHFKPLGLWLSVESGREDGWADWCRSEDFRIESLVHQSEFSLADDANVLWLETPDAIREFTRRYQNLNARYRSLSIDWLRIAREYDGIVIAPYQWECRLARDVEWYYTWDCASACIWNLRAIMPVQIEMPA